ncbi:endolytic transglycosylase MltG [Xanthobacter sp. TB0139]|uniref:endolytic transglycosylase MltG n=1 Tax=Xanthobacter sp. TB0139 TaxID=3459178 RepID=UPI0040397C7F
MTKPDSSASGQGGEKPESESAVGEQADSHNDAHEPARPGAKKAAKSRRKPSRSARHPAVTIGSGIFTFLLLLLLGGGVAAWYGERMVNERGPLATEKTVNIPRGHGIRDIAELLEQEGVIDNWAVFVGAQKLLRPQAKMQAGEYLFTPGQSVTGVIDTLASGKVILHQITIPEGLTSEQIVARLMENDLLTGHPNVPREGTLLPETYKVHRGMSREALLKTMAQEQQELVKQLWAKRNPGLPLRTPQEMVTLASIVEKETGVAGERPEVAAVFVNRLKRGMRLQSDPTIIYGIVGGKGSLGRSISRKDISTPTAYNTYTIDGLPPGPISNPGRDALAAVVQPASTKALFFVADGTGGHAFAETLAQHNRNVARWRAIEAARKTGAGTSDK